MVVMSLVNDVENHRWSGNTSKGKYDAMKLMEDIWRSMVEENIISKVIKGCEPCSDSLRVINFIPYIHHL